MIYFQFNDSFLQGKNPLSYVLLIVCFILAWLETWMLDFKVIPSEKQLIRSNRGKIYVDHTHGFEPHQRPLLFPSAETLHLLLSTGWFQERIRA